MSDPQIVSSAIANGVDAIGMIFFEKSSRYVSLETAKRIRQVVPPFVDLVGVFVNEDIGHVNAVVKQVGLDVVQLHGDETAEYASEIKAPYIRAIRAKGETYIQAQLKEHTQARGFLIDSYHKDKYGGTGDFIGLDLIPKQVDKPLILAGGINIDNVTDLLVMQPYAIDVNSGVEVSEAVKGVKKISGLIKAVRDFDNSLSP